MLGTANFFIYRRLFSTVILSRCFLSNHRSFYSMASKTAMVLLAEGAEEMEAVISIDVLRRGGVAVTVAGIAGTDVVKCSRDVLLKPDSSLTDAVKKGPFDVIVLPGGGKGAENLAKSDAVKALLLEQEKSGRYIAAICAAPAVTLVSHGIGEGKKMTSYPSVKNSIVGSEKYTYLDEKVVVDGKLITSQGPGTAFDFALAIVKELMGQEKADATKKPMLL